MEVEDVGGGSTEFSLFSEGKMVASKSFKNGTVLPTLHHNGLLDDQNEIFSVNLVKLT